MSYHDLKGRSIQELTDYWKPHVSLPPGESHLAGVWRRTKQLMWPMALGHLITLPIITIILWPHWWAALLSQVVSIALITGIAIQSTWNAKW